MCKLIKNINRELREAFIFMAIVTLVLGLSGKRDSESKNKQEFQNHEFDDIW